MARTRSARLAISSTFLSGAIFLWSYLGLFVGAIVDSEFKLIEDEVSGIQEEVLDEEVLLARIKAMLDRSEAKLPHS